MLLQHCNCAQNLLQPATLRPANIILVWFYDGNHVAVLICGVFC